MTDNVKANPGKAKQTVRQRLFNNDLFCGYVFIAPFVIGFLLFTLIPMASSLYLSLTDYDVLSPAKFVGFKNYIRMFTDDPKFWKSFFVTLKYVVIAVPLRLAFALLVAMVLVRQTKATAFYRAAYYLPSLIGGSIAIAVLWKRLFGTNSIATSILNAVGIQVSFNSWIGSPKTALFTLILLSVWQFGSSMLIFLSGLKQIPKSYYESAHIDGAGTFACFFKITLPLLTPVLFFNLVMQTISGFMVFTQSFIVTNGGPLDSTLFYALQMYRVSFTYYEMGYGCAMAWFMLAVIALLTSLVFKSSSAWVYYESKE